MIFLFIFWTSYGHRKGPKLLPWDWDENIFFVSQMSIKCQNFSPKIQLWKNWPFVRESNGVLFSNTHQTVVRWPWHDMISFFYSFLVVEKSCKVFLFKSWHGKKIAWGSSKQMIHTVSSAIGLKHQRVRSSHSKSGFFCPTLRWLSNSRKLIKKHTVHHSIKNNT